MKLRILIGKERWMLKNIIHFTIKTHQFLVSITMEFMTHVATESMICAPPPSGRMSSVTMILVIFIYESCGSGGGLSVDLINDTLRSF